MVLTGTFTVAVLMQFLSLLDFQNQAQDVLCIIVIAWAGIAVAAAKIACLLRVSLVVLYYLVTTNREYVFRSHLTSCDWELESWKE